LISGADPEAVEKVRQISGFGDRSAVVFLLIIARAGSPFSGAKAPLFRHFRNELTSEIDALLVDSNLLSKL